MALLTDSMSQKELRIRVSITASLLTVEADLDLPAVFLV